MLVAAGAKLRHLGLLLGLVVVMVGLNVAVALWAPDSMQILRPHQRARIVSMVSLAQGDTRFIKSSAYQQDKAMTLVSAGGLTGYGAERSGTIVTFNKVPHVHNDMIFAVIANRWGALGVLGVLSLYLLLIVSFLLTAARSKDPLAQLSCVGFAGMIFTQVVINVGMNLGLLPITGITLPFISYGGSSLLATFIMIGLTLNFASRRPAMLARPSFEFDNPDAIFQ
jgi:cell division protein FtsW (lipid II flippase)